MKQTVSGFRIRVGKLARALRVLAETQAIYKTYYAHNEETTEDEHEYWTEKISNLVRDSADAFMSIKLFKFPEGESLESMIAAEKETLKRMHKQLGEHIEAEPHGVEVIESLSKTKVQTYVIEILTKMVTHESEKKCVTNKVILT